jgi:hypothetical protein
MNDYINYVKEETGKSNLTCVVDILNLIYTLKHNIKGRNNNKSYALNPNDYLLFMCDLLTQLISNGVTPIVCFDGNYRSPEKKEVIAKRIVKQKRKDPSEYIRVTPIDILYVKSVCKYLGIEIIVSEGEADFVCAKLCKNGTCDFVISKDMELLTLGCTRVVQIIQGRVVEFHLDTILYTFKISYEQFVDVCVLMGTPYSKHVPPFHNCKSILSNDDIPDGIEENEISESKKLFYIILKLIRQHDSLNSVFEYYSKNDDKSIVCKTVLSCIEFIGDYTKARKIFLNESNNIRMKIELIGEKKKVQRDNLHTLFHNLHSQNHTLIGAILTTAEQINKKLEDASIDAILTTADAINKKLGEISLNKKQNENSSKKIPNHNDKSRFVGILYGLKYLKSCNL